MMRARKDKRVPPPPRRVLSVRTWWGQQLPRRRVEVNPLEKRVRFHVPEPVFPAAQAGTTVRLHEAVDHAACAVGDGVARGVADVAFQDGAVNPERCVGKKRGKADGHLVDEDAEGPPVGGAAVAATLQHLPRG